MGTPHRLQILFVPGYCIVSAAPGVDPPGLMVAVHVAPFKIIIIVNSDDRAHTVLPF